MRALYASNTDSIAAALWAIERSVSVSVSFEFETKSSALKSSSALNDGLKTSSLRCSAAYTNSGLTLCRPVSAVDIADRDRAARSRTALASAAGSIPVFAE